MIYFEMIKWGFKGIHYHKRCMKDVSEPNNSKVKLVSNEIMRDLFNEPSEINNIDVLS